MRGLCLCLLVACGRVGYEEQSITASDGRGADGAGDAEPSPQADAFTAVPACAHPDLILCLPFDGDVLDHGPLAVPVDAPPAYAFLDGPRGMAVAVTDAGFGIGEASDPDPAHASVDLFARFDALGYVWVFETAGMRLALVNGDTLHCQIAVVGGNATATDGPWTPDGAFHHVACVWDGVTMSIYLDGAPFSSNANGSVMGDLEGVDGTGLGQAAGGGWALTGALDDARLWSRALTEAEVCVLSGSASCL